MKALFTYDYGKENLNKIKDLGYDILYVHEKALSKDMDLQDIDVLVCYNPFSKLDVSMMKELKWIQLSSIGIDQVPIDVIKKNQILLTNNKGGYSIPMGEWVVLKILELLKNSKVFYEKQQKSKWQIDTSILELYNKTVGFIGTGSIAKESAKRLQGFDVNLLGLNTTGRDVMYFDHCYPMEEIKTMTAQCDIVVVAIPYTAKTHHLFDEALLTSMKKDAYLINIARGSIIDEYALTKALKNNRLKGAALDVFEEEPLSDDNPLWNMEKVIITPHNSWVSEMRNQRRFDLIYENMKRFIGNKELLNRVDLDKGY